MKTFRATVLLFAGLFVAVARGQERDAVAEKAQAVLKTHCYRCHGQEGAIEGGLNYLLDRDKLVARGKVVPGDSAASPLFKRMASGKMPPAGEEPRPSADDLALVRRWIDAGAVGAGRRPTRTARSEAAVFGLVRDDLDKLEPRARRFARYFTLHPQYNVGLSSEELLTYRRGLDKLLNSLSWHPRVTLAKPVDADGSVFRIDLRDFMWDANLWNKLVAEYPYAVLHDSAVARAVFVLTASRTPLVRVDWFLATASRAPLYYELLQIPGNVNELERQLRVDVALNIQQERVARAGFNGSGISRNNRVLERHDSVHGVYWRTYDFEAVPQNLTERDLLLPDRRNLFAYPLGPDGTEKTFQHAGGEAIFSLPNGLHAYVLMNAENNRIDKGPLAIVSDPKRPDRAVEAGVSCMSCHITGILPKADQVRAHVEKNTKYFGRNERELVKALYVEEKKMKAFMDEDADRYRKALEKTGNKPSATEVVSTMTLRYEADVDLATVAAEFGLSPNDFTARALGAPVVNRNLGGLASKGGTVSRQVVVQAFADVVRALNLGTPVLPGATGEPLPDNTGEVDPLESQSSPANHAAFSSDGRFALIASADRSLRLWDVEAGRDLRRFIGHTGSVWAAALSPDGRRAASGGADRSVRIWDVANGNELARLEGHDALVTAVAFTPDGKQVLSAGLDHVLILWDLAGGKEVMRFENVGRYFNHLAFVPGTAHVLVAADCQLRRLDLGTGKVVRDHDGHTAPVTGVAVSPDGRLIASASDDRTLRLWDASSGKTVRSFVGHEGNVKGVAFSPDGKQLASAAGDRTVRLWDVESGKELKKFARHQDSLVTVAFRPDGKATLSVSRDADVRVWSVAGAGPAPVVSPPAEPVRQPLLTELKPQTSVVVKGTVGQLHLSADGKWLSWLDGTAGLLRRVNTSTMREGEALELKPRPELLVASPSAELLVAVTAASPQGEAGVHVIDQGKWRAESFTVAAAPHDAALDDRGRLFLTGAKGGWTEVTVVDTVKRNVAGRFGGVWARSLVRLSADQKSLYLSSQGVTPATLEVLTIPERLRERPTVRRISSEAKRPLGGELVTLPGGLVLLKNGTALRLQGEGEPGREPALEAFLSATFDASRGEILTAGEDGLLRRYRFASLDGGSSYRVPGVAYQVFCDGKRGRLYVAAFDPRSLTARPRPDPTTEIQVYDTARLSGPATPR